MNQSETSSPPPESDKPLVVNFFREIRSTLPKSELETNLWVTKKGVFVRIEYIEPLLHAFVQWFQKTINHPLPLEKASRKLFGEEGPAEFYLIQGSSVVVGVLVEAPNAELRGVGIRVYEGMPLDASATLHHTDPLFSTVQGLTSNLTRTGYEVCFETKTGTFRMTFGVLSKFRAWLSETGEMRKHIQTSSIRRCVESLRHSLNHTKAIGKRWDILIPNRLRELRDHGFFMLGSIFMIETGGYIVDFFPSRGRALGEFIREELALLTQDSRSRNLAGAYLQNIKGSFVASKDVAGLSHRFGVSAVQSFLDQMVVYAERQKGRLPGKIEPQHTIRDCVLEISKLLSSAEPIRPDKVPAKVQADLGGAHAYLSSKGEWFFSVDPQKMIRHIAYAPKSVKKELKLIPLAPAPGDSEG